MTIDVRTHIASDGEVYLNAADMESFLHDYADAEGRSAGGPAAAMAIRRIAEHVSDRREQAER